MLFMFHWSSGFNFALSQFLTSLLWTLSNVHQEYLGSVVNTSTSIVNGQYQVPASSTVSTKYWCHQRSVPSTGVVNGQYQISVSSVTNILPFSFHLSPSSFFFFLLCVCNRSELINTQTILLVQQIIFLYNCLISSDTQLMFALFWLSQNVFLELHF